MTPWSPATAASYGALTPQAHLEELRPLVREALGLLVGRGGDAG